MRKVFLDHAVVELVYKFDEKSTASVQKGESFAKVLFKRSWGSHTYILIYKIDTNTDHITTACTACAG